MWSPCKAPMRRSGPNSTIFIVALLPWLCYAVLLGETTVAGRERHVAGGFSRRQTLNGAAFAHDAETIRQSVVAAMQSPWRALRPFHRRLHAAGRQQPYFLSDA